MNKYKFKWKQQLMSAFLFPMLIFAGVIGAEAEQNIPNGELKIAYRQKHEGKLSEFLYQVVLACYNDRCSLTTLTLNQCFDLPGGRGFFPKVERSSTDEGTLKVYVAKDDVIIAQETYPSITLKYRFEYTVNKDKSLQAIGKLKSDAFFKEIKGFSGAVAKDSDIVGKAISWEMIPLKGRNPRVKFDCEGIVFGIPED